VKRVAAIAILNDHHMLMGKRRDNGKWTNPGGHLNPGEDPVKGAAREVKEETGLDLDPHLFKHLESRVVKKPDGTKIEVHGYRVDLNRKPSTSMGSDPDQEVTRWQWVRTDNDLEHLVDNLHVPLADNVLLTHILEDKPMKKHVRRFWHHAKKMGSSGFMDEIKDKAFKEAPQQYLESKKRQEKIIKQASEFLVGGKGDGKPLSEFPKDQVSKGMKVEREHTTNPEVASEIVRDHLSESSDYYTELGKMEDKMDKKAFWRGFMKGLSQV